MKPNSVRLCQTFPTVYASISCRRCLYHQPRSVIIKKISGYLLFSLTVTADLHIPWFLYCEFRCSYAGFLIPGVWVVFLSLLSVFGLGLNPAILRTRACQANSREMSSVIQGGVYKTRGCYHGGGLWHFRSLSERTPLDYFLFQLTTCFALWEIWEYGNMERGKTDGTFEPVRIKGGIIVNS